MITVACTHCGRAMKHGSLSGMGPKCARSMLGIKPKRARRDRQVRDTKTRELFPETTAC